MGIPIYLFSARGMENNISSSAVPQHITPLCQELRQIANGIRAGWLFLSVPDERGK